MRICSSIDHKYRHMKKIKIALIGAGYISDYHAKGLQSIPNIEITTVVARTIESAKKFAHKYGIAHFTIDMDTVYKSKGIDAVIISTPNQFHAPYAIEFLKNGKDVFLEKPMGMNSEEGRQIAAASEEFNQLVMVGHMWHFDIDTNYLKDYVKSGKLGTVFKTKGYGVHENWGPSGWFTKKELAGGGALADMGVHAIDTIRYILGNPKPAKVYARISTRFGDYDVDDTGIIVITWDNGVESIIESGWWHPHMMDPKQVPEFGERKGTLIFFQHS